MFENVQFLTISADEAGQRLDNYLLRVLKKAPKSLIYRIIRKGEVRINKGRAKPKRKLQQGDVVRIPPLRLDFAEMRHQPSDRLADILQTAVLYEDDGVLVVNKPGGLAVHGGSGISLGLIEALREIRSEPYLELVHRLDRETSGCIILAKKRSVLRQLHQRLRDDWGIDKQYLALVKGQWSKRKQVIDVPLRKNELSSGERVVRVDIDGKPSKSLFAVENQFECCSLVRVKPVTGRTHQIRVHAQYAKHPLVGDEKYGDADFNKKMKAYGAKRLFLHAVSLEFSLDNAKRIRVEAPLPRELTHVLTKLSSGEVLSHLTTSENQ